MCNYCFVVLTIPLCLVTVNKFYSILFYSIFVYISTKVTDIDSSLDKNINSFSYTKNE